MRSFGRGPDVANVEKLREVITAEMTMEGNERERDEHQDLNIEEKVLRLTGIVTSINVELLIEREVFRIVQSGVCRRVELGDGLSQSSSEPFLDPTFS